MEPANIIIDDKLDNLNHVLDEYETKNGLPSLKIQKIGDEIELYFTMSRERLSLLSAEDCAEIAVRLTQHSIYVQRLYNKERAQVLSLEIALDKFLAQHINNYNAFMKHEMKVASIVNEHDYAKNLQTTITKSQQRMARLYSISDKIHDLSQNMLNLQRSKISHTKSTGG